MEGDLLQMKYSSELLETTLKINVFASTCFLFISLAGHIFTIVLYCRKRFFFKSTNIHLLCLAIVDSSFLIVHL